MKEGKIFTPAEAKKLTWEGSKKGSPGVWIKDLLTEKENDQVTVRFVKVKTGGEIILHTHDVLEVFYIIKGEGKARMGDTEQICSSGTCLVAPAGVEHGMKNIGKEDIMLLCIFNPPLK